MELKHTKGSWIPDKINIGFDIDGTFVSLDNDGRSRQICWVFGLIDAEKEANARLISCAPEMLEALIKYYKICFPPFGSKFDLCEIKMSEAKELIERATGLTIEEVLK